MIVLVFTLLIPFPTMDEEGYRYIDFQDPRRFQTYPNAPRRPPKWHARRQIVWPRDKKQKGPHTWSRLKDLFSSTGPDMWVGKQGDDGPNRNAWTHWGYGAEAGWRFDNMGYRDRRDGYPDRPPEFPILGHRSVEQKYDFRTRKYKRPGYRDWSDVKWDRRGQWPLYVRNAFGYEQFQGDLIENMTPWEQAHGLEPFRHNDVTSYWNWYFDEKPWDWAPQHEPQFGHGVE